MITKNTFALLLIFFLSNSLSLLAQENKDSNQINKIADSGAFGLGMGQIFGGFGANALAYPQENIGIFAGLGYAVVDFGYNIGTKIRFFSKNNPRTNFYLVGMYGYNAAIAVEDEDEYNKMFYGPTFGFGIDTGKRSYKKGYWTMALLLPIRNSDVNDYMDELEDDHNIEFENDLFPITFSIGYHFSFN